MSDTIEMLRSRRSVAPVALHGPAPTAAELDAILTVAARVPDHGKLVPWRFIVFAGEDRTPLNPDPRSLPQRAAPHPAFRLIPPSARHMAGV